MRTLSLSRQEPKENLNEAALKRATLVLLANEKDERRIRHNNTGFAAAKVKLATACFSP
jgi:hypothetical protein